MRDGVVSTMILELNERQRLGGFNQNQVKEIFHEFRYEILDYIGGRMGGGGGG